MAIPMFSRTDLQDIISNYDLGNCVRSKKLQAGSVQTNILIETENGKFVLKYYANERTKDSVLFEVNLMNYLGKRSFPCPRPFKSRKGEYVGIYDHKTYVLYRFIEGSYLKERDWDQKKQLIEKVALLHNLTRNYRPKYLKDRWNYDRELCLMLAKKEANKIGGANAYRKLEWLKEELSSLILPSSLPKGICHCDFHSSNVLFLDGKFNALVDFDDANRTFLLFDLAALIEPFIPSYRWDTWDRFDGHDDVLDYRGAKKTIAEYSKYRVLRSIEKKHLFDVYKLSILLDAVWYFKRGDANEFYEKDKIERLDAVGREAFRNSIF